MAHHSEARSIDILERLHRRGLTLEKQSFESPEHEIWRNDVRVALTRLLPNSPVTQKFSTMTFGLIAISRSTTDRDYQAACERTTRRILGILESARTEIETFGRPPAESPTAAVTLTLDPLLSALSRFAEGMVALRQGKRKSVSPKPRRPYVLDDEYDVQDALWLYVKMAFADARREDPTPRRAGTSSSIDFTIPSLATGIEAKHAKGTVDVGRMKKDLLQDIHDAQQREDLRCLIIFIAEAAGAAGKTVSLEDLEREHAGLDVRVVRVKL